MEGFDQRRPHYRVAILKCGSLFSPKRESVAFYPTQRERNERTLLMDPNRIGADMGTEILAGLYVNETPHYLMRGKGGETGETIVRGPRIIYLLSKRLSYKNN